MDRDITSSRRVKKYSTPAARGQRIEDTHLRTGSESRVEILVPGKRPRETESRIDDFVASARHRHFITHMFFSHVVVQQASRTNPQVTGTFTIKQVLLEVSWASDHVTFSNRLIAFEIVSTFSCQESNPTEYVCTVNTRALNINWYYSLYFRLAL